MYHVPLHTEFAALLGRAAVSQARFARLCGVTVEAVNNWCRGRREPPKWAVLIAAVLEQAPSLLEEEVSFDWPETLGIGEPPEAITLPMLSKARNSLAKRYHPDTGGNDGAMKRINAAYDEGKLWVTKYRART